MNADEKNRALDRLSGLFPACSSPDWEGDFGLKIKYRAAFNAASIICALSDTFSVPDIDPSSDGTISLEWYRSLDRIVSVVVGDGDFPLALPYAYLVGSERGSGVLTSDNGELPELILRMVAELFAHIPTGN